MRPNRRRPPVVDPAFLDTNVILRHLLQDRADWGEASSALLKRIQSGELTCRISDIVVFEAVFTLQRTYGIPRAAIAEAILPFLDFPGIVLPNKAKYAEVFALYVDNRAGFADCYHAVMMRAVGIDTVYSYDAEFDSLPGITRVEPPPL